MPWRLTSDVELFATTTERFLRTDPVRHTVFLTLIATLRSRLFAYGQEPPYFGWWTSAAGEVDGVLLQTPPYPVLISGIPPEAVAPAAEALAGRQLSGANLAAGDVDAFVAAYGPVTIEPGMRTRLYRLGEPVPPSPTPSGFARPATADDRVLVITWLRDFYAYVEEPREDVAGLVDDHLAHGGVTLWIDGGAPVSMSIRSRPESGMVRILHVWTPPSLRRRGYAAGVTAESTRLASSEAAEVVLYTDLANPTSNALYQRLGYRPVEDRAAVAFS
ncbi:GNAT family N-acetyltransferase [Actinoplanes sp. NPDC051851]|uniref:GNAT family N-acetyltransferase n=1 Tax=Actinoplanes sp. NPDC051851 TaxID=3154753 RepID=UPI0034406689